MSDQVPAPTNRRERPPKPALTREGIIATALELFRSGGLSGVTMRSVARALDTGHASLYVYVRDTADLHAQILDAELAAIAIPDYSEPWRSSLVELLMDYRRVLFSNADIAKTVLFTRLDGPNYTALAEAVLTLLDKGGITGQAAAWGVDVLLQQAAATAAEHAHSAVNSPTPRQAPRANEVPVDANRYPRIAALREDLFSGTPTSRSEWAITMLIEGLLAVGRD
jgi:AcrR family transcriptional regulator